MRSPLPEQISQWLTKEEAIKRGYEPFAGPFLPHEYSMLDGFIRDLRTANRPYCGVNENKYGKGLDIYAKKLPASCLQEEAERLEDLRETEEAMAQGTSEVYGDDPEPLHETISPVSAPHDGASGGFTE